MSVTENTDTGAPLPKQQRRYFGKRRVNDPRVR
jgi:hypothetical protein